jgi:hypothetical protein
MANLWDPFPMPLIADLSETPIYTNIGKVISAWEMIEFSLARLYSFFAGDPDGEPIRDYGRGQIFKTRLDSLKVVAERWFVKFPDQAREGLFDRLCEELEKFADRRNEVAHATVLPINRLEFFVNLFGIEPNAPQQWLLIPPYHTVKKHDAITGLPNYAYSALELNELFESLVLMMDRLKGYRVHLNGGGKPLSLPARPWPWNVP